jgi:hypothetical protein
MAEVYCLIWLFNDAFNIEIIGYESAFSGMRSGKGTRWTRRKPASMPLCQNQFVRNVQFYFFFFFFFFFFLVYGTTEKYGSRPPAHRVSEFDL